MGEQADPLADNESRPNVSNGGRGSSDTRKQAVDFAADATKQLITVAAGIVTATVIFSKDLKPEAQYCALAAWVAMTFSILGGLGVLFILTGKMRKLAKDGTALELDSQISYASGFQWLCFLGGMALMIAFGFVAAGTKSEPETKPTPITVTCVSSFPPPAATIGKPATDNPAPVTATGKKDK